MIRNKIIQVFEYSALNVGENQNNAIFTHKHFKYLIKYNEKHGNKFFTVGYNKIIFKHYTGVLQVGDLIIEILPKMDNNNNNNRYWQHILIDMLYECNYIKIQSFSSADLSLRSGSLLNIFIDIFLSEIEVIIRKGLVKKYRMHSLNTNCIKGKISFSSHLKKNIINKNKFFTITTIYDYQNLYNRILKTALLYLTHIQMNQQAIYRLKRILFDLQHISPLAINNSTFYRIQIDKKTKDYDKALKLARLIITNYTPDIIAGKENVLAILFNMNTLFEEYIYWQIKKWEKKYNGMKIVAQKSQRIWKNKTIRPDIVISYNNENIILDTKWKKPLLKKIDSDLKQMFIYNLYWNAHAAILLYPAEEGEQNCETMGYFVKNKPLLNYNHMLHIMPLKIVNKSGLIPRLGKIILDKLLKKM